MKEILIAAIRHVAMFMVDVNDFVLNLIGLKNAINIISVNKIIYCFEYVHLTAPSGSFSAEIFSVFIEATLA